MDFIVTPTPSFGDPDWNISGLHIRGVDSSSLLLVTAAATDSHIKATCESIVFMA
jgi:hypothetical protein